MFTKALSEKERARAPIFIDHLPLHLRHINLKCLHKKGLYYA